MTTFHTPVLLVAFNRPEHTRRTLEAIMVAQPQDLYVFQDGAREGNEDDIWKCAEVRQVVEEMTTGTQTRLHLNCAEKNLGCGPGPASGITWFFGQVEQGIIVEDDCVLSPSAFAYYECLLDRYRDDDRVSAITATNLHLKWRSNRAPYLFATVGSGTLGCWASWSRAWKSFDYYIQAWHTEEGKEAIDKALGKKVYREYYKTIFDKCDEKQTHMWDYQWFFAKTLNNTLTVVASLNQVSNIGFDEEGTHTLGPSRLANFPLYSIPMPMKTVPVRRAALFDWAVFQRYYNPKKKSIWMRVVLKFIDALFRH